MARQDEQAMRSDHEIREDLLEELDCDPQIGARDIAVAVRDGVVTLAGFVRSHGERARANYRRSASGFGCMWRTDG
jgi:osmotically-inducible protein OsmY